MLNKKKFPWLPDDVITKCGPVVTALIFRYQKVISKFSYFTEVLYFHTCNHGIPEILRF